MPRLPKRATTKTVKGLFDVRGVLAMTGFAAFEDAFVKLMALEDAEEMLSKLSTRRAPTRINIAETQALLNQARSRIDFALAA